MKYIIALSIILLASISYPVYSQDEAQIITYGETVQGKFPVGAEEVEFTFSGLAGDIVVIESKSMDILNGFMPEIQILNARGTAIADTTENFDIESLDFIQVMIPLEIPADGDYTIIIKNGSYFELDEDADFELRLLQPEILANNTPIQGTASTEEKAFYVVISNEDFSIDFSKVSGDMLVSVSIGRIESGGLETLAVLYGEMTQGNIQITPNRNTLHLITIQEAPYEITIFGVKTADFELTLNQG